MKSDSQVKTDVEAELQCDPSVHSANVGVAVKDGVVTLAGTVDTFVQKHAVERAVRRVAGVRGIGVDLEVQLAPGHRRTDTEIAHAVLHALRWHSLVPADRVAVAVDDGWVTLSGEVDYAYQMASAEQCVRPLVGVRGVTSEIRLRPRADAREIRGGIEAALARHARREARRIEVDVTGGIVTLSGTVESLAEHDAALGTAAHVKGVTRVVDHLNVVAA